MIRSPDHNVSIKAIEARSKREEQRRQRGQSPEDDGFSDWRFARDVVGTPYGAAFHVGLVCDRGQLALSCLSMFHDVYWAAIRDAPELIERLRARQSSVMLEDLNR